TDPHLFSGIGNAYSDEILFDAQLSPVMLTKRLTPEQIDRLFHATRNFLTKLRRSVRRWRCMDDTRKPVRAVMEKSSAFVMRRTKPTTARRAKPVGNCWLTAR